MLAKALTQRLERTSDIVRQQTGRWHRRQNKFMKPQNQTKLTLHQLLLIGWVHSV